MSPILYKMDISPPSRTVMATAQILGLDVETKETNLLKKDNFNPEYVEKNPLHTIPLLEDGDFIVADSHAIIIYLISKYGGNKATEIYPSDVEQRATVLQRLFLDASILFPRLRTIIRAIAYEKATGVDEKQRAGAEEAYGFLEKYLEKSLFLAGERLTIADIACVTTVSSFDVLVPIGEKYLYLRKWLNNLKTQDWYVSKNQPGLNDLQAFLDVCLKKNKELSP